MALTIPIQVIKDSIEQQPMMFAYDGIIIDDIGYVQQSREEMEVLFTFLADRYEQGSVMVTSNLPFSKWGKIFIYQNGS